MIQGKKRGTHTHTHTHTGLTDYTMKVLHTTETDNRQSFISLKHTEQANSIITVPVQFLPSSVQTLT